MTRGFFNSLIWRLEVQDQFASFVQPLTRAFCRWYSDRNIHKGHDGPHGRQEWPHRGAIRLSLYENSLSQKLVWEDRLDSRRPAFIHSWSQTPTCVSHFLNIGLDITVSKEATFKLWHNAHPLGLWPSSWRVSQWVVPLLFWCPRNPSIFSWNMQRFVHLIEKEV